MLFIPYRKQAENGQIPDIHEYKTDASYAIMIQSNYKQIEDDYFRLTAAKMAWSSEFGRGITRREPIRSSACLVISWHR